LFYRSHEAVSTNLNLGLVRHECRATLEIQ
jgi:hypothetical protein